MVRRRTPKEVIDLHGLPWPRALEVFFHHANRLLLVGYKGWFTVILGYGSSGVGGKIKEKIRAMLMEHAEAYESHFNDGANPGSTEVRILRHIAPRTYSGPSLEDQILQFCATPKDESKLRNKFRRHLMADLTRVLRTLRSQGRLEEVVARGRKAWRTADEKTPKESIGL